MSDADAISTKRYTSYKESGVPWLGQVPEHWRVIPNKFVMHLRKATVGEDFNNYTLLSLTKQGVIPRNLDEPTGKFPESFDTYQAVEPGDLVFCLFDVDETPRTIGIAKQEGMVTGAYTRFVCTNETTREFTYLLYLSLDDQKALKPLYTGLRKVITKESFLGAKIALPPLDEQAAIVRYLDDADQRIREYVSAKERLIALLQEERQAVIHQAATRGLDSNVKLKPSGVEWLGDVPEHWDVRRLKFSYSETDERSTTGSGELMSVSHKTGVTPRKKNVTMFLAQSNEGYKVCRPGDIVVNTMWAYMAALGISRQTGLVSPSYGVYRPIRQDNLNQEYIDVLLRTETYRTAYVMLSTGITDSRLRLYADSFLGIYLLHPPVSEQAAIVRFIDKTTADIDAAIDLARGQIELTEEYRTRLIADVVTGKMDVRSHYDSAIAQEYGTEWKT